ncbi:MAG: membrane integrity-associated transporter subunit PqiC [Proteobacteria bacterium]|nr:membrane integrity-associated transporter subunit PqiC [Pseudomonadota bacterium]
MIRTANPGRTLARRSAVAGLAASLLLAACTLTRPAPVKETFLLDPPAPPHAAKARPESLRVGIVTVGGAFRDRPFVIRDGDLRFTTDYYNEFITAPAPMLAEVIGRSLREAGAFARVGSPGTPGDADLILDAFVDAMYLDQRSASDAAAQFSVTFYLTAERGSTAPFWSKRYSERVPVRGNTASAYVEALNKAVGQAVAAFVSDLPSVAVPPPPPR